MEYNLELKCKSCGTRMDIARQDASALLDQYHKGGYWPFHCGHQMNFHPYRPTRYEFCEKLSCRYGQGNYCACTCEGTFHGVETGRTQQAKSIY